MHARELSFSFLAGTNVHLKLSERLTEPAAYTGKGV